LTNLATHYVNIHPYAADCLVKLFVMISKKWLKTEYMAENKAIEGDGKDKERVDGVCCLKGGECELINSTSPTS
jgi:hypothetical protein